MVGLVAATACKKNDAAPAPQTSFALSGALTGAQSVPATPSTATGTLSGAYNSTSKVLTYSVTYSGLTPIYAHFHIGTPTTARGPVTVSFPFNNATNDGYVSPITGTATLDGTQETALLGNAFYVNLHSAAYPSDGEIRTQVAVK